MKKFLALLLAVLMIASLAACGQKPAAPAPAEAEKPEEPAAPAVLADEGHAAWVAHGQYLLADGTQNGWGGKDTEVYEASALKAIALEDVKAIDEGVFEALSGKDVKFLYATDLIFGTNDAGWSCKFLKDGKLFNANGSYAFKVAQCTVDIDGDNKVYSEDQWISDPKTAYVEALTPDTVFYPAWQEEKDENGFSWADNPVVTGGAGLYTVVVAQYANASAPDAPGYGVALILKEAKDGIPYEEILEWIPGDHSYGIVGSFAASNWGENPDVEMALSDNPEWKDVWVGEVDLKAGEEFKVRADGAWDFSWGTADGGNCKCEADGTYVVVISFDNGVGTVNFELK